MIVNCAVYYYVTNKMIVDKISMKRGIASCLFLGGGTLPPPFQSFRDYRGLYRTEPIICYQDENNQVIRPSAYLNYCVSDYTVYVGLPFLGSVSVI